MSDRDEHAAQISPLQRTPTSPPPSFRSRASSPQHRESDRLIFDQDRNNLAEAFHSPSDSDSDSDNENTHPQRTRAQPRRPTRQQLDERQRVMSGRPADSTPQSGFEEVRPQIERRVTQMPIIAPTGRVYGGGSSSDGVFANLSAKPTRPGEDDVEEKPPVSLNLSNHECFTTNATRPDIRASCSRRNTTLLGNHHPHSWHV